MREPSFTIGIEEEYQTVDPVTFDLRSHIATGRSSTRANGGCRRK
jgi:hypothetical protein